MEAAIQIQVVSGAIAQFAADKDADGIGNVLRSAPASNRKRSLLDEVVVLLVDNFGHIGINDTGPNLIDIDALCRQTVSIQQGHHSHASLGHTVFAAADGRNISRAGTDIDDGRSASILIRLLEHLSDHQLCKEHCAFQVDAYNAVKVFLGHFENVTANQRCNPCVVDQNIHITVFSDHCTEEGFSCGLVGDAALIVQIICVHGIQLGEVCAVVLQCIHIQNGNVVTLAGQLFGHCKCQ